METIESKGQIIKQTFASETLSVIGNFFAGSILVLLILPFKSFLALILMLPALLTLRGNISSPFIARNSKDLIIGEFSKKTWFENILATYLLSFITAIFIGVLSLILNLLLFNKLIISVAYCIFIPLLTNMVELTISIPFSTSFTYIVFKKRLNPNNIVNPIMTTVDDFLTIIVFYFTLIFLGVP